MDTIGKCPKCEQEISEIKVVYAPLQGKDRSWKGTAYLCPHCSTVLSTGLDPLAQTISIVDQIRSMILAK